MWLSKLEGDQVRRQTFPTNEILSYIASLVGRTIMHTQVKLIFWVKCWLISFSHFLSPFLIIHIVRSMCWYSIHWTINTTILRFLVQSLYYTKFLEFKVLSAFALNQNEIFIALAQPLSAQFRCLGELCLIYFVKYQFTWDFLLLVSIKVNIFYSIWI